MVPTIPQLVLTLVLAVSFVHFLQAGARTFVLPNTMNGMGVVFGGMSFASGALITLFAGVYLHIHAYTAAAGAVLVVLGVGLYEWARHTIAGRRFYVGLSEGVPEELCEAGPYAYVRHPIYTSYMVTFLALLVAFPHVLTGVALVLNVVLFVYMAKTDERVIAGSPLADAYAEYRKRVGMFFPRLTGYLVPPPPSRR